MTNYQKRFENTPQMIKCVRVCRKYPKQPALTEKKKYEWIANNNCQEYNLVKKNSGQIQIKNKQNRNNRISLETEKLLT